ncbi:unnamed protein product, partial [Vitis vinifera]
MADQIPFGVVEHILTKLGSKAFQEIGSMYGVPKELTKLKDNLDVIKGVLLDAEEQQQQKTRGIEAWVQMLKGAVYDADDLLDDYATHYLQRGGFARQVSDFFSSENQVAFRFKMSHRLNDINERLDAIEKKIPMLNLTRREAIRIGVENSWRETHSFSLPSEIVGREENKEEIIRKLSSNNEEILSVVAIVGFGGLGKTTLTQLVYNDERVEHFERKTWVCISDDSGDGLDVKLWVKKILKSMGVQGVESLTLDGLKDKLHEKISQKKYLLVLDDVWNENPGKWYEVKKLLMVGARGSKIIVTTRKLNVASIVEDKSPLSLKGLGKKESRALFSKFAFREQEILKPEIVEIGEEIAKMCKGVPLIIKTLAMILHSKRELGFWLSIRNNIKNLLLLGVENDNVVRVLKLSYDNLPTHLKQCFTYCALFPKDYEIEKRLVVQLWIAQGYIQSSNDNNEQLEDIGDQYVEELLSSLSELKGLNQLRGGLCVSDLQNVRDVELVSRGEILKGKQYLQSLRLEWDRWGRDGGDESDKSVMEGLQPHQHLKDIFIEGYGGTEFPSWMMNDGLGSLFPDLIKIEISGCSRCKILPPFSQLPSLKSLKLHNMKEVVELKEGSLTTPLFPSLESLELSDMPKLKELWRMDLLAEKPPSFSHLSKLYIYACSGLASLHPSPSLSQLKIHNCPNLTSMELPSSLCLSQLDIRKCPNLASFKVAPLPSLGILSLFTVRYGVVRQIMSVSASSSLRCLYIKSIDDMISLPKELLQHVSGLVTLEIRECPNLQSLELPSSHCLSKLKIGECPNLASFNVASLPRLEELSLRGVRAEVLRQFMFVSASSSLKSLHIRKIDGMISLPEEPLQYVSTLETLHIVKCSGLATLLHWMGSLSSLTELIIYDCSELTSLPEEVYSLKKLQTFYFCDYPHLEERYNKETGKDRAKIARIPHVRFNSDTYMVMKVGPKSLTFLPIFII